MRQQKKKSVIKKVIIPAAGLGTRFLPATKAMPKEMLPVVDKPVIQYIVEEAVASGIEDVIIVTGQNKRAIEDHFDQSSDLVDWLESVGKHEAAEQMRKITSMANFIYIRQKGPYGNGTPVLNARHMIGPDEAFAVIWGDDLVIGDPPRLKELMDVYEQFGDPVLTAYQITKQETTKYGVIDPIEVEPGIVKVKSIVEKPEPHEAPSTLASLGGYVLTPDIFKILEETKLGKSNELWLVDALFALSKKRTIYAKKVSGTYHDVGSKLGWLRANIELGLMHTDLGNDVRGIIDSYR